MDRFPDTVFKIAGYLSLSGQSDGFAIPILESIENEGIFFVQEVHDKQLVSFIRFEREFTQYESPTRYCVTDHDDQPLYCFISHRDITFGNDADLSIRLRTIIDEGTLGLEASIEAAYFLNDEALILTLLDDRYFQIVEADVDSAEFFCLNNILRDRVIEKFKDKKIREIMVDVHLSMDGDRIKVGFPASVDLQTKENVLEEIQTQVALSRSFLTKQLISTSGEDDLAQLVSDCANMLSLDLDYSDRFLRREGIREIFIPLGLTTLRSSARSDKNGRLGQLEQKLFDFLVYHDRISLAERVRGFIRGGNKILFNLHESREIASVMIKFARAIVTRRFIAMAVSDAVLSQLTS